MSLDIHCVPTSCQYGTSIVPLIFVKPWVKCATLIFYFAFSSLETRISNFRSPPSHPCTGHLHYFTYEMPIYILCQFFPFLKISLITKSSSYVLHINYLVTYAINIFSQPVILKKSLCLWFICHVEVYSFYVVKCFHLWILGFVNHSRGDHLPRENIIFPSTLVICFNV